MPKTFEELPRRSVIDALDRVTQDDSLPEEVRKASEDLKEELLHWVESHGTYKVSFEPMGKKGKFSSDQSLLNMTRRLKINLMTTCGGNGLCGRCKVQIIEGEATPLTQKELEELTEKEVNEGYRLACQTYPLSDLIINIPPSSLSVSEKTLLDGYEIYTKPDPIVKSYRLKLDPEISIYDAEEYAELVLSSLKNCDEIDIEVLRILLDRLGSLNWEIDAVVRENELIAINPPSSRKLGFAVDLGTTKIAGYIVDLDSGRTLVSKGITNPQMTYGEDVITRLSIASQGEEEAEKLQMIVVEALNDLIEEMCDEIGAGPEEVLDTVIASNTAMHHLLLGLPVTKLGISPYIPTLKSEIDIKARDIGLVTAPGAYIHFLPNIAGFVGGDHVAMMLSTELEKQKGPVIAIDIGTNTEICLCHQQRITSVSCASGPAFEGRNIKHGMRGSEGAIEKVRIIGDDVKYHTIREKEPIGICGSGILDAVAQLYLNGIIDSSGMMKPHKRVRKTEDGLEFVITDLESDNPITITQKDVHEILLAKGAIHTGIQVLLEANNLSVYDLEKVIISGGFGTFVDISSAITIGMLPPLPLDYFEQVGNAAGVGAKIALVSRTKRDKAVDLANRTYYIEMAEVPNFMKVFAHSTFLGSLTEVKH
ncbi:MAG: ASKHA domain-containing protein [Archaeoglobaceae archaeon]